MTQIPFIELLISNLDQSLPVGMRGHMTQTLVIKTLKKITDFDFGDDPQSWRAWLIENGIPGMEAPPSAKMRERIEVRLQNKKHRDSNMKT